jgi:hypothetical protein
MENPHMQLHGHLLTLILDMKMDVMFRLIHGIRLMGTRSQVGIQRQSFSEQIFLKKMI